MYVERGGEQVFRGPFLQSGTGYRAFVIRADRDRLAALCERTFVRPTGGAVRVRPITDAVLVSFAGIERISSLDPEHARFGTMPETDLVFWVPVEVRCGEERLVAWFIPYIFVDAPPAMATGREHYGFPKSVGAIHMPPLGSDAPHAVDTMVIERLGVGSVTAPMRLLEVVKGGPAPSTTEQLRALSGLFGVTIDALAGSLRNVFTRDLPVLFLRQLRDVAEPSRAAFTEVLVASTRTRAVREVGHFRDGYTLRLAAAESHPIGADLGLAAETPIEAAFHMDFDFEMGLGRPLWRSTGGDVGPGRKRDTGEQARSRGPDGRERIVVLGGGIGALSAVYEITDQPGWAERYDITVYQMGWRLGGKGASGRNADAGQRIEEHGLHIWFGFYENAFRLMRRCYAEAGRAPGTPLATWRDAFHPHSRFVVQEEVNGAWVPWDTSYPTNDALPGDASPELTPVDLARQLARWGGALLEEAIEQLRARNRRSRIGTAAFGALAGAVRVVQQATLRAIDDPTLRDSATLASVTEARRKLQGLLEREIEGDTLLRRAWIGVDWVLTNLHGMIRDGVLEHGFDVINHWDYQAWMRHHGASEMTIRSAPVRAGYDLVFAFRDGDPDKPDFAAGVGLYGLLRMFFTYKGAVAWKMQGGMGDVVFTPLYEVLKRRGVRFAFFHKVEELGLSDDGARIGSVRIARQATPRGDYQPLVTVKGVACWPDRPDHDQLVEGEALRGVDLESTWNGWEPVERATLREGTDFDSVILGIPVGALRKVCAPLVAARREWRDMVENVSTVCTHAFQLWTTPDLAGLGWTGTLATDEAPIVGSYVEPTDTWADMTHLVPAEAWPQGHVPGHVAYFCGPMPAPAAYPSESDTDFPRRERARAMAMARRFLDRDAAHLWRSAVDADGRFQDALLVDIEGRPAEERFARQLFKANVEPTDRYTQSRAGTIRYRLRADGSGFANLFLAGDWIDNGFNAGCIEATVMSGMLCARAVTGADLRVHGENPRLRPAAHVPVRGRRDLVEWVAARGER